MLRFETASSDFTDDELGRLLGAGQVYLDVSSKRALDDFAKDLRSLELSRECVRCAARSRCGGCWVGVQENRFVRDERRVHELLRGLSGSVLDVGAGEAPYARELQARAAAGHLRYLGIDPDFARLRLLRARNGSWARYQASTLEGFAASYPGPRFDHVLVLRSWNHLPDPAAAAAALARLVRPGGTLLAVDNVAFAVLRTARAAAAAERGPGTFEHFRNDTASDALNWLAPHGFRVISLFEVGPSTSNQWLLHTRLEISP